MAETIIAYVTPTVVSEVEEKLPFIADKRGLSHDVLLREWATYKGMLHIKEPDHAKLEPYANGQDPDDAPTLALADTLQACGILSLDSDILAMGGRLIPIEFIFQARDYSRKAAISVSIRVGGYFIVVGASGALKVLTSAIEQSAAWFRKLPHSAKSLAFMVLILGILHPKVRNSIAASANMIGGKLPGALSQILQLMLCLAELAADNEASPPMLPVPTYV